MMAAGLSPIRRTLGLSGTSSATSTPQYQPFGLTRERSDSFDPASFMRRQSYQYQRGLTDQSYGQRANEARAVSQQGSAQAGLGGGAALSNQSDAIRNVLMAKANEQGQLGSQYMAGEAQAAQQAASLQAQLGLQELQGSQALAQIGAQGQQQLGLQTQAQQFQYEPSIEIPGVGMVSPVQLDILKTLVGSGEMNWRDALDYILGGSAGHPGRNNPAAPAGPTSANPPAANGPFIPAPFDTRGDYGNYDPYAYGWGSGGGRR